MPVKINNIRERFTKAFLLLMIVETLVRLVIALSYTNKIYTFSFACILLVSISLYILYIKRVINGSYATGLILFFYFLIHFIYLLGTYNSTPIMALWLLVVPMAAQIYYSNKVSVIICIATLLSFILVIHISTFTRELDMYRKVALDYYGTSTAEFILNFFVIIVLFYVFITSYFLIQVLMLQYPKLGRLRNIKTIKNNLESEGTKNMNQGDYSNEVAEQINTVKDVRLLGLYQSIINYMEVSECYLNSDYTLDQLAIDLKTNRISLSNSLNRIGKISFKDLLNQYRINKAKKLFSDDSFKTTSNIKQIYLRVGFNYHTTFNRVFKKLEGITPSEYIVQMEKKRKNL